MAQPLFPNLKPSRVGRMAGFLLVGLKWWIRNFIGKNLVDMVHINLDILYRRKKTIPPSNILAHIGELAYTRVVVAKF
jgi:hypothetical protein